MEALADMASAVVRFALKDLAPNHAQVQGSFIRDLVTTIVVGSNFLEQDAAQDIGLHSSFRALVRSHSDLQELDNLLPYPVEMTEPGVDSDTPMARWFLNSFCCNSINRAFFVTLKEKTGMSHGSMQIGDDVCILFGSKNPYVLRLRPDGKWTFVGDSYLPGIMGVRLSSLVP